MDNTLDDAIWPSVDPEDLWIYDKLILSRKLGYNCGPSGVKVPHAGLYIVRPITNLEGMGVGAEIKWINEDTYHLVPAGYFWCEVFEGRHLSVDYVFGDQVLCVEGIRDKHDPLYKWQEWKKVDDHIPLPEVLASLPYKNINCEFVGGNLIEAHLRPNPDFQEDHDVVYPVWEGQSIEPPTGFRYKESPDYKRQGFFIPI